MIRAPQICSKNRRLFWSSRNLPELIHPELVLQAAGKQRPNNGVRLIVQRWDLGGAEVEEGVKEEEEVDEVMKQEEVLKEDEEEEEEVLKE